eukprot:4539155-Heterocapsa_arctica.AAC.1
MKKYLEKEHEVIFDDWWACKQCKAKGPAMNKKNCPSEIGRKRIPEEIADMHNKKVRHNPMEEVIEISGDNDAITEISGNNKSGKVGKKPMDEVIEISEDNEAIAET